MSTPHGTPSEALIVIPLFIDPSPILNDANQAQLKTPSHFKYI